MTGTGTQADPYIIYDVDDLQAIEDMTGTQSVTSLPWDDSFGNAGQYGTWTIYPEDPELETQLYWDKLLTSDADSTYIQARSTNAYCLLSFTENLSLPTNASNIEVVIYVRCRNTAVGQSYIRGMVRDSAGDYFIGSNIAITSNSYALRSFYMKNPPWRDSDAWTTADVWGLTTCGIGVVIPDAFPNIRITQMYLRVTYRLGTYFALANNIDASETATWNEDPGSPGFYFGFEPISDFDGSLDGKGYTISGLHINRPSSSYCGLLGTSSGATVSNLTLDACSISGYRYVGVLVGRMYGGGITNVTVTNPQVSGYSGVGGLAGEVEA